MDNLSAGWEWKAAPSTLVFPGIVEASACVKRARAEASQGFRARVKFGRAAEGTQEKELACDKRIVEGGFWKYEICHGPNLQLRFSPLSSLHNDSCGHLCRSTQRGNLPTHSGTIWPSRQTSRNCDCTRALSLPSGEEGQRMGL